MGSSAVQLYGMMRKRIMTTMIGALASLEEHKDLFDEDDYEDLRKEILDKDIDSFDVKYKTVYFMPLRRDHGQ